ncbi:MAG: cytochrome-c oxidase, cbb3-type subunit II [Proteobacteria bacterium]|nr:cytochrome-c oxidase, cbb3-type subunit II [Pseudomonadota bacterium]
MSTHQEHWHRRMLEHRSTLFAVLTVAGISVGSLVEIVPMFAQSTEAEAAAANIEPYSALELAGRDIYLREGCYTCHSQMVRPMRAETLRYGEWSRAEEYTWDRPFQLGSRRIGPDLHRVGGKYPDAWHYEHMRDPRSMSTDSVMPNYPWLLDWSIDSADIGASMKAHQRAGTPYTDEQIADVATALQTEGQVIVDNLAERNITTTPDKEIVALIAYLQRLGTDRPSMAGGEK